ncbi:MAG: tape measure protein [Sphingobacteriaceae bacterium]|nr:tape measure protein [Sphingobacteriaceae bacterium]
MSNNLEYVFTLRDKFSDSQKKIQVLTNKQLDAFAALETKVNNADTATKIFGKSIGSLRMRLEALRSEKEFLPASSIAHIRTYNSEIKRLEKQLRSLDTINGNKFKAYAKDAFTQLSANPIIGIATNPLVAAGAIAGQALKKGFERESAITSLTVLNKGDAVKANTTYTQVKAYGDKSPYESAELLENVKLLQSFGVEQGKVINTMKMLGDVAMGDQNKLNSLSLAFAQIKSAGKMQGQDLMQLVNAGFNPLQVMATKTGKSMAELKEAMGKGAISAKMVEQAFIDATTQGGLFYGMSDKMAKTGQGKWSTAMDAMNTTLGNLGSFILPAVIPAIDGLGYVFGLLSKSIEFVQKCTSKLWDFFEEGSSLAKILGFGIVGLSSAMAVNVLIANSAAIGYGLAAAATWAATAANTALNAVLAASPYGLALLALGGLYVAYDRWNNKMNESDRLIGNISSKVFQEKNQLNSLFDALARTEPKSAKRNELLGELKEKYPDVLEWQKLEAANENDLAKARATANAELEKGIILASTRKEKEKVFGAIQEAEKSLIDNLFKKEVGLNDKQIASLLAQINNASRSIVDKGQYKDGVFSGASQDNINAVFAELSKKNKNLIPGLSKRGFSMDSMYNYIESKLVGDNEIKGIDRYTQSKFGKGILDKPTKTSPGNLTNSNNYDLTDINKDINSTSSNSGQKNITINVQKIIEGGVNITSQNIKAGASEMEQIITEALLRVLNSGGQLANG